MAEKDDWQKISPAGADDWQKVPPPSLGRAAMTGLSNIPASAGRFASDIAQPLLHPIATAESLGDIGRGVMEKLGITSGDAHVKYADAVGKFLKERYGSEAAIKNTLATDPVGMAGDLAMLLSGGGGAVARLPGVAGRVGQVASAASRFVDPLSLAVHAPGAIAPHVIGDFLTHTGAESVRTAARAGYQGGPQAQAFQSQMRGTAPMSEAVQEAEAALQKIRQQRSAEYRSGMVPVKQDATVLSFHDLDQAIADMEKVKTYAGRSGTGPVQNLSPKTDAIRTEMINTIKEWRALDPAEFHSAEGMDALKQKLGGIRDATAPGTPERTIANEIYGAARNTIVKQVPEYAKVMEGYEEASSTIKELQQALSLNDRATVDTKLRKLQSVLRNNVNTNYGQRQKVVEYLASVGGPTLMEKLAGQAMSSWTPRGFGKWVGSGIVGGAGTAAALGSPAGALQLATLPLMSPRLMGEAAYYGGRAAKGATTAATAPLNYFRPGATEALARAGYRGANVLRAGGIDALTENPNDALAR